MQTSSLSFSQSREEKTKKAYTELKNLRPDLYERCVQSACAAAHNLRLDIKGAAELERTMVSLALECLHV